MKVRPIHVVVPLVFALLLPLLEGLGVGLLVPAAQGVAENSFKFLQDVRGFRSFPALFELSNMTIFSILICTIFAASILKVILAYISEIILYGWERLFLLRLNRYLFSSFLTFGKQFYDKTSVGHVGTTLGMGSAILGLFNDTQRALQAVLTILCFLVIMASVSWKMTLLTLAVYPFMHLSLELIVGRVGNLAKRDTKLRLEYSRRFHNVISCIPLVKATGQEHWAQKSFEEISHVQAQIAVKTRRISSLQVPIQETIILSFLLLITGAVCYSMQGYKLGNISKLIVFLYIARRVLPMFQHISAFRVSIAKAAPKIKLIAEMLANQKEHVVKNGSDVFKGLKQSIRFSDLSFSYDDKRTILNSLNFDFEKNKMTAIVGPTGAGKTTILNLLMRFYDSEPNSLFIDEKDIRSFDIASIRKKIAYISQETYLLNDTIEKNLIFGADRDVSEQEMLEAIDSAQLSELLQKLSTRLKTPVGERGLQLSGGERQRLAIARAMLRKSEILLLDEATSALDSETEIQIQKALDKIVKNRTTIAIAHRLSTIKNADKVIVIENGQKSEEGTFDELVKKRGAFYSYWKNQSFD